MSDALKTPLNHRLKSLRLPTVLRDNSKLAKQAAAEGLDHVQFIARLIELEMIARKSRMIERRILGLQKHMVGHNLLTIDDLCFPPHSKTGTAPLCELISQSYERGVTLMTSRLPVDKWTETFGAERMTSALLDRLTHHVNILGTNAESSRHSQSKAPQRGRNRAPKS